jgi:hypothetical protein
MASLIVIALVTVVTGVLVGAFIAVSIAIRLGKGVRSLIWRVPPAYWVEPWGVARRPRALASAGAAGALGRIDRPRLI